ncbi:MAG: trehalose synthase [Gilvibacter sp.]
MAKATKDTNLNGGATINVAWEALMDDPNFIKMFLSEVLEKYIVKQRWYGGKSSKLKYIDLTEYFRIQQHGEVYYGLLLEVNFEEAFYQHYFMPIAFVSDEKFAKEDRIMSLNLEGKKGYLIDAINLEAFRKLVFERILNAVPNDTTRVQYHKGESFTENEYKSSRLMGMEQSNTSVVINESLVMKFFRRIYSTKNPDYEMSRFLSDKKGFTHTPAYRGSINLIDSENLIITIALMQELVPNEGDAWEYSLKKLHTVFKNLDDKNININALPETPLLERLTIADVPPQIIDWAGLSLFLEVQQLAKRTAEMHICLGSEFEETAFTPERFNGDYEVWLKNRLLYQFQNRLNTLENNLHKLDGLALELANRFLAEKNEIRKRFMSFNWTKFKSERLRVHGDYHLGQILVKDGDFYILDFEGEPESTIRDRKVKQPPVKDVAGLFRSYHYAIYATIFNEGEHYSQSQEQLFKAGEILFRYITGVFMDTYVKLIRDANINIGYEEERNFLLKYTMLEKAVYELGYELNARPRWAVIPLEGIASIMKEL